MCTFCVMVLYLILGLCTCMHVLARAPDQFIPYSQLLTSNLLLIASNFFYSLPVKPV